MIDLKPACCAVKRETNFWLKPPFHVRGIVNDHETVCEPESLQCFYISFYFQNSKINSEFLEYNA